MSSPFVNFQMSPTGPLSNTPALIFGKRDHTCLVDGIVLTNLTDKPILVSLSVSRVSPEGQETRFVVINQVSIPSRGWVDVLREASLTLEAGDSVYAASDYSNHLFNTFVSYRELMELPQ